MRRDSALATFLCVVPALVLLIVLCLPDDVSRQGAKLSEYLVDSDIFARRGQLEEARASLTRIPAPRAAAKYTQLEGLEYDLAMLSLKDGKVDKTKDALLAYIFRLKNSSECCDSWVNLELLRAETGLAVICLSEKDLATAKLHLKNALDLTTKPAASAFQRRTLTKQVIKIAMKAEDNLLTNKSAKDTLNSLSTSAATNCLTNTLAEEYLRTALMEKRVSNIIRMLSLNESQKAYDQAKEITSGLPGSMQAATLELLALRFRDAQDYKHEGLLLESALKQVSELPSKNEIGQARLWDRFATACSRQEKFDERLHAYEQCAKLSKKLLPLDLYLKSRGFIALTNELRSKPVFVERRKKMAEELFIDACDLYVTGQIDQVAFADTASALYQINCEIGESLNYHCLYQYCMLSSRKNVAADLLLPRIRECLPAISSAIFLRKDGAYMHIEDLRKIVERSKAGRSDRMLNYWLRFSKGAWLVQQKQFPDAIAILKEARELHSDALGIDQKTAIHLLLAEAYRSMGNDTLSSARRELLAATRDLEKARSRLSQADYSGLKNNIAEHKSEQDRLEGKRP